MCGKGGTPQMMPIHHEGTWGTASIAVSIAYSNLEIRQCWPQILRDPLLHLLCKIHLPLQPVDSVPAAECNKPNISFPFLKGLAYYSSLLSQQLACCQKAQHIVVAG